MPCSGGLWIPPLRWLGFPYSARRAVVSPDLEDQWLTWCLGLRQGPPVVAWILWLQTMATWLQQGCQSRVFRRHAAIHKAGEIDYLIVRLGYEEALAMAQALRYWNHQEMGHACEGPYSLHKGNWTGSREGSGLSWGLVRLTGHCGALGAQFFSFPYPFCVELLTVDQEMGPMASIITWHSCFTDIKWLRSCQLYLPAFYFLVLTDGLQSKCITLASCFLVPLASSFLFHDEYCHFAMPFLFLFILLATNMQLFRISSFW
jgi:hypothetical protein